MVSIFLWNFLGASPPNLHKGFCSWTLLRASAPRPPGCGIIPQSWTPPAAYADGRTKWGDGNVKIILLQICFTDEFLEFLIAAGETSQTRKMFFVKWFKSPISAGFHFDIYPKCLLRIFQNTWMIGRKYDGSTITPTNLPNLSVIMGEWQGIVSDCVGLSCAWHILGRKMRQRLAQMKNANVCTSARSTLEEIAEVQSAISIMLSKVNTIESFCVNWISINLPMMIFEGLFINLSPKFVNITIKRAARVTMKMAAATNFTFVPTSFEEFASTIPVQRN